MSDCQKPNDPVGLPFVIGLKRSDILSTGSNQAAGELVKQILWRACLNSVDLTPIREGISLDPKSSPPGTKSRALFEIELVEKIDQERSVSRFDPDLEDLIEMLSSMRPNSANRVILNLNFKWINSDSLLKVKIFITQN